MNFEMDSYAIYLSISMCYSCSSNHYEFKHNDYCFALVLFVEFLVYLTLET